jgi:hypothetical protein
MKKLIIFFILIIAAIVSNAQTAEYSIKRYNTLNVTTDYVITNAVADTFIIYAPRNYPCTQAYSVNLDSTSGDHTNIATSLYGSLLGVTYTQIGSTDNWTGTNEGTTTVTISNSTANRYNYYMVIFVGTGTGTTTIDWQRFQIWTAGELSDGTATLSAGSFTGIANIAQTGHTYMVSDADSVKFDPYHALNVIDVEIGNVSKFSVDSTGIVNSAGQIKSANGVDLGTSKALTGTTGLTIGAGTETVAVNSSAWDISATSVASGLRGVVVVNTDESETLTAAQSGAIVTFDGAGTATIPDPSAATVGVIYYLLQTADAELIVTATTADNNAFVCDNVATSDAITYGGASHLIGGGMIVIGISATQWYVGSLNGEGTLTPEAAD